MGVFRGKDRSGRERTISVGNAGCLIYLGITVVLSRANPFAIHRNLDLPYWLIVSVLWVVSVAATWAFYRVTPDLDPPDARRRAFRSAAVGTFLCALWFGIHWGVEWTFVQTREFVGRSPGRLFLLWVMESFVLGLAIFAFIVWRAVKARR